MYNLTDERNAIRELQRYLLEISYATDGLPHLSIDGIYGDETRSTVLLFQTRNGLPTSGEADPATWQEIYRQFRQARDDRTTRPFLLPPDALPLSLHMRGSEVMLLQILLSALGESMHELPPVSMNGHFDPQTQRALRAYQEARSLPPSGVLDGETWEAMTTDYQRRPDLLHHAR